MSKNVQDFVLSRLLTLILLFGLGEYVHAERWNVEQYSLESGLSNSCVTSVFQDSFGFIWVGTDDGLNRYDGYQFKVYRHNPSDSTTLIGNAIQCIVEAENGDIWIGTKNSGISIWKRKDGTFTNLGLQSEPFRSLKECGVFGMMVENNHVWVKTRNYIFKCSDKLDNYETFGHYSSVFKSGSGIAYPLLLHKQKLWVGSKDGIHQFDTQSQTFNRIAVNAGGGSKEVTDLLQLNDSCLLFSTSESVSFYNTSRNEMKVIYANSAWNEDRQINCLYRENDKVWVGTSDGLMYSDTYPAELKRIVPAHRYLSEVKHITCILIDESGLMWLGTGQDGLFKVDRKPLKFTSITQASNEYSLDSYNFKSVYVDDDGGIWLGTNDKGVYRIDQKRKVYKHYSIKPVYSVENDPSVLSICKDENGTTWFGTSVGIYTLGRGMTRLVEFDYGKSAEFRNLLTANSINSIIQDRIGNMWFATQFGLYRYNGKSITSYFADEDNLRSLCADEINVLFEDSDGWIWIGTDNGINIFNAVNENFTSIRNVAGEKKKISHNIILSFAEDKDKRIIIGTQSGLSFYDKNTETPGYWTKDRELTMNRVYAVEVDAYNRIWMSSGKGIASLISNQNYFQFSQKDGVPNATFNNRASFNFRNEQLFFAGDKGLAIIQPDSIRQNLIRPKVVVTDVQYQHKSKTIERYQGNIENITIKYKANSIVKVDFAAMEFSNPTYNYYKVFLEGFDDNWRPVTRDNHVSFANLSPGEYTLKINGANSDFVWNNDPTLLRIVIKPPLWMTNYAYAFYLIFAFIVIQTLINYRFRKYRKAYKDLKEKEDDKRKIEAQKETLSSINQSLTDSISYAKRIQEAMIPSEQMVKTIFPESFVYFRPKDIVSGDFYWVYERENKVFVAAVDCTGHGVPGAFMSIIGYDLLKNIVEIQGAASPDKILDSLNCEVVKTFSQNGYDKYMANDIKDGMDMALVIYDRQRSIIEFAGAKNPIYIIHENEITVHKGDRMPIGHTEDQQRFSKKKIQVSPNDIVYMFSDGYADQFGGPEGKKFKYRRFRHLLLNIHKLPIEDQKAILHQKMEEWMGSEYSQVDDILLMAIKL